VEYFITGPVGIERRDAIMALNAELTGTVTVEALLKVIGSEDLVTLLPVYEMVIGPEPPAVAQ